MQPRFPFVHGICFALTLAACGDSGVTFYSDVKPIIDARCGGCHHQDGIAPFALETFDDASIHAGVSKLAIEAGTMPPWHASDDCNDYVGKRSLTPDQKKTLLDWIEAGSPEGDPARPGKPITVEHTELTRVDRELPLAEPYTPTVRSDYRDDYRCFVLPWPDTQPGFITGFRAVPGEEKIVHHVIAFLATPDQVATYNNLDAAEPGPGYPCFGATGGPAFTWLGAWAPGSLGNELPDGVGIEIMPGSAIVLQVHYNLLAVTPGSPVPADQTKLQFRVEQQVQKTGVIQPWANPAWILADTMRIPANEADVMHQFSADPNLLLGGQSVTIYGAGLHMHKLGKSGRLSIKHSDGTSTCLLQVDDYDFNWQDGYVLRQSALLERGDQLELECHWDNTAGNQPLVNGEPQLPREVSWGEGTSDEMCLGILLMVSDS